MKKAQRQSHWRQMRRIGHTGRQQVRKSTQELLHLNPLQSLNTSPHRLANPDGQFPAFEPLIDKPQTHDELFLVE